MMTGGVSFQPGSQDERNRINPNAPNGTQEGVQDAIKVLSLRLPKVVGAQAIAPNALLRSEGSGGNPRVDSIVGNVMQKFFPSDGATAMAPGAPMSETGFRGLKQQDIGEDRNAVWGLIPRIIADTPPQLQEANIAGGPVRRPGTPTPEGQSFPFSMVDQTPDLRRYLDWLQPSTPPRDETPLI